MTTTIIVGVDARDGSADALVLASTLADATRARLVAATVYACDPLDPYRHVMRAEAEAAVDLQHVDAHRMVAALSPARALHDLAEAEEEEAIVVGSSSRGRSGRVLPGSVGERLLNGAPCAVAVAPRGYAERKSAPSPVGAAYDGLPESRMALATSVDLARMLGAPLKVISVFERPARADRYFAFASYDETVATLRRGRAERLRLAVEELAGDLDITQALVDGEPARALTEASGSVRLLVCGSRGYGPLRRVLLGGVSADLIRHAACPILVVPRGAARPFAASAARALAGAA